MAYCTRLFYLFPVFATLITVQASAQGIVFEHGSFQEALDKAATQNKYVFLDAYTTWCGPCKMLAAQTFPDSAVGALFNERFVSLKMDMEKGEGVALATKYGVELYPTLLFFTPGGKLIHRASGFYPPREFLALGYQALDPQRNLSGLNSRYRAGQRDPELLFALLEAKAAAYDPEAAQVAREYLETQPDLNTDRNLQIVYLYCDDPYGQAFRHLMLHRALFEARYSAKGIRERVNRVFENYLQQHPNMQPEALQQLYSTVYPERGPPKASAYRLDYYRQRSDTEHFLRSAADHYQRFPTRDAAELNEAAWLAYKEIQDKNLLETALEWSKTAVRLSDTHIHEELLKKPLHWQKQLAKARPMPSASSRAVEKNAFCF
jgi:thiol-disulfide isomerase/thioredoxin